MDFVQQAYQGAVGFAQGGFVDCFPVRFAVLPAAPDDALPFEGQSTDSGVVAGALGALLEVVGGRPAAPEDTLLGVFVETLPVELGAEIAAVNVAFAAALFGDGGHAGVALEIGGRLEALALRAQAGQEPGAEHRAGAGEAGQNRVVGMLREGLSDLFLILVEGLLDQLELAADELDPQHEAADQGGFVGDRHGLGHQG